jgi:hypothetical protein
MGTVELAKLDGVLHALGRDHHPRIVGIPERMQDQGEAGDVGGKFGIEPGGETLGGSHQLRVLVEPRDVESSCLSAEVDADPNRVAVAAGKVRRGQLVELLKDR